MFFSERSTVVSTTSGYARLFSCIIRTSTAIRRGGCIKSWHLFAPKNPQYQSKETSTMAFLLMLIPDPFWFTFVTQGRKLKQKHKRILTLASCCSVSKPWRCNKACELGQCWLCPMCEREYTQRFICSHTCVRYSIVTQFASVLVCYCKMKSASIVEYCGECFLEPLRLTINWDCFRYRETIIYWLDCGLTRYVIRTSFIASANPFWKWV